MKTRKEMRAKRKLGSRVTVRGTESRPRLAVYRSNTKLSAQLIDDEHNRTTIMVTVKEKNITAGSTLGKQIAEKANVKHITTVVFDRGGFRYHGVVKAVADAAREGGLVF